ncbi:signal peptidase I [Pararhodonellum marinum]|uniref:signal peptidase I n=1 Tax=Pararhodonellum marinum TaxID=2755358 RepID=UPI00188E5ED0|nr:signal peptidase I [Pararhodonellum marinum]
MKANPKKSSLIEWRNALVFAVVVATFFRWSLAEAYVIPTGSMENSLLVGDYILVSKIHYGSRTPQTPLQVPLTHQKIWGTDIPSYLDWVQLPSYRLPGLRNVERGETVVFNTPKDLLDPTDRPDDLMTFLVKRCVAISGDVLEIRDRQIYINDEAMVNPPRMKFQYHVITQYPLQPHHLANLGLDGDDFWFSGFNDNKAIYSMFLTEDQLEKIQKAPYLVSVESGSGSPVGFPLFPATMNDKWDLNNYGPLTLPQKGLNIDINENTLDFYGELIEKYEGNRNVKIRDGKLEIDGKKVDNYTFKQGYYFMMGDSRDNSIDSRYWGFVPESHIVGKPLLVLFSKNEHGKGLDKVRWERIFSRIE